MRIAGVETRRYAVPFEPPVKVAWDPVPRARQEATLVIVHSDEGVDGYASGDALPDRELLERLVVAAVRELQLPDPDPVDAGRRVGLDVLGEAGCERGDLRDRERRH